MDEAAIPAEVRAKVRTMAQAVVPLLISKLAVVPWLDTTFEETPTLVVSTAVLIPTYMWIVSAIEDRWPPAGRLFVLAGRAVYDEYRESYVEAAP